MSLIDSHCHLNYEGLAERQEEVLAAARARGVEGFLNISTRQSEWSDVVGAAELGSAGRAHVQPTWSGHDDRAAVLHHLEVLAGDRVLGRHDLLHALGLDQPERGGAGQAIALHVEALVPAVDGQPAVGGRALPTVGGRPCGTSPGAHPTCTTGAWRP